MEHVLQQAKPRIYVACLAAYNNGILHGAWIDADQEAKAIHGDIAALLKTSPIANAEEWAIRDFEGFDGFKLTEGATVEQITKIVACLNDYGRIGGEAITYFGDVDSALEALKDRYVGLYPSLADFAQELTEGTTEIPAAIRGYIDYDRMGWDLSINDVVAIETGSDEVHIFRQR